jgi:hypothetical protein
MDGGDASRGSVEIPWAIGSLRTVKRLRLSVFSTPLISRGIVTVRSDQRGSLISHANSHIRVRGME